MHSYLSIARVPAKAYDCKVCRPHGLDAGGDDRAAAAAYDAGVEDFALSSVSRPPPLPPSAPLLPLAFDFEVAGCSVTTSLLMRARFVTTEAGSL